MNTPLAMPKNDEEADLLRAYIPTQTLVQIAKIRDEEIAEHDKQKSRYDEALAAREAIKERMRKDRIALKKAEQEMKAYFSRRLFQRTDAARQAAWNLALEERSKAVQRGETIKSETVAECGARQKSGSAIYTP